MRYRLTQTAPPRSSFLAHSMNPCLSHGPSLTSIPSPHFLPRHDHPDHSVAIVPIDREWARRSLLWLFIFQPPGTLTCLRFDDDERFPCAADDGMMISHPDHPQHTYTHAYIHTYKPHRTAPHRTATDGRLSTIFRSISMRSVPDDELASIEGEEGVTNPQPPQQRGRSPQHRLQTEHLFLGITSTDGSQVYYKLSNGIVKPPL